MRRYSNKELKMNRELIVGAIDPREYVTLSKSTSFQHTSGVPGIAYNLFIDEEARVTYFDYE